jgi:hypothetical protein
MARGVLKAGRGYEFVKRGRSGVTLRKKNSTGTTGVTFNCSCEGGSGGCKVVIQGQDASCFESGCSDTCSWVVKVPGLVGARVMAITL